MERISCRSKGLNKVFRGLGLLCLLLLVNKACAREFLVGGSQGWSVPSDPQSYNQWAERNRFQVGDSLLFVYPSNQDSVLQVTSDAYTGCNTDTPIAKFTDGHTSFAFNQSGPYHFISGNKDNCQKNEKLLVIVMAERSNRSQAPNIEPPSSAPPSPSPSGEEAPSPPSAPPSPSPSGEEAPSPPVTGTIEINPTPAPSQEPKPNGARSSVFVSSIGFFGATLSSSLLLLAFSM